MKKFLLLPVRKFNNMKYRKKLTIILVVASLLPMIILALYSHNRMSRLVRTNEIEDMNSILQQTREGIDSQIEVYTSLINYLTYSPDIEEIIEDKNMDSYVAYEKYTQVADPLLSVPKSYHQAISQIQLFADSIPVRHEYTLAPLAEAQEEWWYSKMGEDVLVQWIVNSEIPQIAAVRQIYENQKLEAILCITLDYNKIFQPFGNIVSENSGGLIIDSGGKNVYHKENMPKQEMPDVKPNGERLSSIIDEYAYVSSTSESCGWTFYLYRPKAAIDSSVYRLLLSEIPLILLLTGMILVLGLVFSRLFTRKIEALTENMKQVVDQGSREVLVESDSEDEVGLLVRSFKTMMEEIDRLIHEVYENRIALKEFELKALTAQINPHFLYNSLSIINWMAIRGGQKDISKVTLALSTFYRTALSKGQDIVTVDNCIQNIQAYLDIQLVMHDNDFQVLWDVDPEIRGEMVPKLVLQPVVENALEHGLDVKEEGEKILKLSFLQDRNDVLMVVEDNGLGMEQEQAETLVTYQAVGYGLKNVNDRICLLYGKEYRIRIKSQPGAGTRVEMRIPKGDKGREN